MKKTASEYFWKLTVYLFPITTLPAFSLGQTVVKPISILPATFIVILYLLFGGNRSLIFKSKQSLFLILFLFISIISYLASGLLLFETLGIPAFFRAGLSLFMGLIFYFSFRLMNQTSMELARTEIALQIAMTVSVFLAFFQFVVMTYLQSLAPVVKLINYLFVDVATVWTDRFHGLAYEPSWLASQLCVVMIPLSLSRVVTNDSLGTYSFLFWRIKKEFLFLLVALIGVFLSGSRTGVFTVIAMICAILIFNMRRGGVKKTVLILAITGATVYFASSRISYVGNVFEVLLKSPDILDVVLSVNAAPRIASWVTGWRIFLDHPYFGVGLGNSFNLYSDYVPDWALSSNEVQAWVAGISNPNPKNMFVKLLAETGIFGFLAYIMFIISNFAHPSTSRRIFVLKILALVGLGLNFFSLDTFALPTEWFILGYICVATRLDSPTTPATSYERS